MSFEQGQKTFDLSPLLTGETDRVALERRWADTPEQNGISLSGLSFSGECRRAADEILLTGKIACQMHSVCARCLAPVSAPFQTDLSLLLLKEPDDQEERDVWLYQGESADLYGAVEETLLLDLPLRLLCREDCKGLCPKCGKNLNEGDCGCVKKEIDPRLQGLADFFK